MSRRRDEIAAAITAVALFIAGAAWLLWFASIIAAVLSPTYGVAG